jgi:hypothetical protein
MAAMQGMISKLKLTVNEERTRLCLLPEESFDPPPRFYDGQKPTLRARSTISCRNCG